MIAPRIKSEFRNGDGFASPRQGFTLPTGVYLTSGRYAVSLATTDTEKEEALRLRFRVFNLELKQGLPSSVTTGMDEDAFDRYCDHLIVRDLDTQSIVGTYRLQTREMAARGIGFYSESEFNTCDLPNHVLDQGIELGRACIAPENRNTRVLFLLWSGLAQYLIARRKRYFFGCCSISGKDPAIGSSVFNLLKSKDCLHPGFLVTSRKECRVTSQAAPMEFGDLPPLFRAYLRNGAKVCSYPAIYDVFGTIDFLIIFDRQEGIDRYTQGVSQ